MTGADAPTTATILAPTCPRCGGPPLLPWILPYFCADETCRVLSWNPLRPAAEFGQHAQLLDLDVLAPPPAPAPVSAPVPGPAARPAPEPDFGPEVVLEAASAVGDSWFRIGAHGEAEPCGTLSSSGPGGRQVYLFGFRDAAPGVWRTTDCLALETWAFRAMLTRDLEQLSDLAAPYELTVRPHGRDMRVRFRLAHPGRGPA